MIKDDRNTRQVIQYIGLVLQNMFNPNICEHKTPFRNSLRTRAVKRLAKTHIMP